MIRLTIQNPKLKSAIRWLPGAFIVIFVVYVVITQAARALPHIAVGQIAELTNTKIEAESVDFNIDGSVFIKKLVVRPYKKQSYDDTILKAETVYARFGLGSLLLLRPRLKAIDVNDFVFNALYDWDAQRWNLSALKIEFPQSSSGKIPRINLVDGVLKYSKISGGRLKVAASIPISISFGLDKKTQKGYRFDMTTAALTSGFGKSRLKGFWRPGMVTVAGGISSTDVPSIEMAWAVDVLAAEFKYDPDNDYSLKLRITDFHSRHSLALDKFTLIGPSLLEKSGPFAAMQTFFDRYRPAGRIDINLDAVGNLKNPAGSALTGSVICKDVSICDRMFPYAIEHLAGQIDFTRETVALNNLIGKHGDVVLSLDGWSADKGEGWQYQVRMSSDNMALDKDLYNALNDRQKKFWSVFSPSGRVAIDHRLQRNSPTDEERALVIELRGTEAKYTNFPYPLKNLTGKLFFNRDDIVFSNVVSQVNQRKIVINGKSLTTDPDRPIYDLTIDVNNVPLDSTLEAALPDRQRSVYQQFELAGLGDGRIKVATSQQQIEPVTFTADLSFKDSFLKSKQLPLTISDVSAAMVFTPDMVQIDNFSGLHSDGPLSVAGRIWLTQQAGRFRYSLVLNGRDAQLDEDLFGLLPDPLKKNVLELRPQGKINYVAYLDKADANDDYPDYRITVDCLGDSINYRRFGYPLKDITGRLAITKRSIRIKNIVAAPANSVRIGPEISTVKLDGEIVLDDNVFNNCRFDLNADNILFDENLGLALPEKVRPIYRQLSPVGRFDMNSVEIRISGTGDGPKQVDFEGGVKFKGCGFHLPGDVTEATGRLTINGSYKTGEGLHTAGGVLSADSIRIGGAAFIDLNADILYDKSRRLWSTRDLIADCYGGGLAGKLEVRRLADDYPEYLLQIGFSDIDLRQFLLDVSRKLRGAVPPPESHSKGRMGGSLSVNARYGEDSSRIGICRLVINDMQVGHLSPMAKLLQVLKLNEPRDFAFDRMLVDSYVRHNKVFIRDFDLSGRGLAFNGSGCMDLQKRNIELVLAARGDRLAAADPSLFQSLAEGLGRGVVRVEVTGDIYDPKIETKTFPVFRDSLNILGTKSTEMNP